MKFIQQEQFNNADKKVKDEVYKWWKENISIGDLFYNNIGCCIDGYVSESQSKEAILGNTTPLLTVGQLIDFIESKTGYYLEIKYDENNDYGYIFDLGIRNMLHYSKYVDLLKALWELVGIVCE